MRKGFLAAALLGVALQPAQPSAPARATNVILFLADAGGIPTINAASIHGYGAPRHLFVQHMPQIGLSETSTALEFVSDSAAGMTAIVTGQKTRNEVISQSASAVPGQRDGKDLKSILDYAEEHGLATGFVTNDWATGATPAALYAKINSRRKTGEIFLQLFHPAFGDGVDVAIASGHQEIEAALKPLGRGYDDIERTTHRKVLSSVADIPKGARRAIVLYDTEEFDHLAAVQTAIQVLSRSPRGYFLMVEEDVHTDRIKRGLDRMVAFDKEIRQISGTVGKNTLVLFTADHSFDIRTHDGQWGEPLLAGLPAGEGMDKSADSERLPNVWMDNSHTGEEVLVAAQGPGAERVHGYMANTDLFGVMMRAYGWPVPPAPTIGRQ